MKKYAQFIRAAAAGLYCLAALPGYAASGTVDLVISTVSTMHSVEMADTTVTSSGGSGTLTLAHSSGRPFEEGASASIQYAGFSKKTPSGLNLEADGVATFSPDDSLLMVFERKADDPGPSNEGALHLTGGSGRFSGVSGECRYRFEDKADSANVTVAKCEWTYSFPYR